MLKQCEDISATQKRLTIEIPADIISSEYSRARAKLQQKVRIPGFRPGKAPLSLIDKKYHKEIEADILEKLVARCYLQALSEANLVAVSPPMIEKIAEFKKDHPVEFVINVSVRPPIPDLNYTGLPVTEHPIEVTEQEVTTAINEYADKLAEFVSTDEPIIKDDLVTVDYTAKTTEDADETSTSDVILKVGASPYPPEFIEHIIGKKTGDEVELTASFASDSPLPFAGKTATFKLKIKDVKRKVQKPIDDEFAKDLGFGDLVALQNAVKDSIIRAKTQYANEYARRQVLDALMQRYDFELPETLLQAKLKDLIEEALANAEDLTDSNIKEKEASLRETLLPTARHKVKAFVLLDTIADKENVTITEQDIQEFVSNIAKLARTHPENVIKYYMAKDGSLAGLRDEVRHRKTLDLIVSKANFVKGETK